MTGPIEIEDFEPLPTDMLLYIRNGQPVLKTPDNAGGVIPEDCLLLVAVAASWSNADWRAMMLNVVDYLADSGELTNLMTRQRLERPN